MKKIRLVVLYSLFLGAIFSVFTAFKSFNKNEQYKNIIPSKLVEGEHQFNAASCASCHGCTNEITVKNDSLYLEKIFFTKHDSVFFSKEKEIKKETVIKSHL